MEAFFKLYSNLPMNLRGEVILVIDDQPITWKVAYNEVSNKTDLGKKIFNKLVDLNILPNGTKKV